MQPSRPSLIAALSPAAPSDLQLARDVAGGDVRAFEALMRRHNRLIFRTVRSVIRSDVEAEDVTQDAWLVAYRHIAQFEGRASFSTWLTRIAIRIALLRMRQERKLKALSEVELEPSDMNEQQDHPARMLERRQLTELLERAIDRLPFEYRVVLVLREVEQRSTSETAESLGTTEENVRVRLHRARAALRELLKEDFGDTLPDDVFAFDGERCNRMTSGVLERLARES
jgi:RNA polymerase sigma-70 factor, ECF subfamily